LLHLDGLNAASGITTIGINTTGNTITVKGNDVNFAGILTATKFGPINGITDLELNAAADSNKVKIQKNLEINTVGYHGVNNPTNEQVIIKSTYNNSIPACNVTFYKQSANPADGHYISELIFKGRNDNNQDVEYANILAQIVDVSDGDEGGEIKISTMKNGTSTATAVFAEGTNTFFGGINASGTSASTFGGDVNVSGVTTSSDYDLSAISGNSNPSQVKHCFVYDTSKDSDGGAWRDRTDHTSWYNESSSSTRSSRSKFPSIAIITTESAKVRIYDGDDPELPLWMEFGQGSSGLGYMAGYSTMSIGSAKMINGILMIGLEHEAQGNVAGLRTINFITEDFKWWAESSSRNAKQHWPIADRNTGKAVGEDDGNYILAEVIHDFDMKVYPNSEIDPESGLPRPTIVLGHDRGISIISDTLHTIKTASSTSYDVDRIRLTDDKAVIASLDANADNNSGIVYGKIALLNDLAWATYANWHSVWYWSLYNVKAAAIYGDVSDQIVEIETTKDNDFVVGSTKGLNLVYNNPADAFSSSANKSMVARVTKDFCSGWMTRNIKGAWLADTDDTNVSADTLQDESHSTLDSTFATTTGWSGQGGGSDDWTISGGKATCNGNNTQRFLYPNDSSMFAIGTSVAVEVTVTDYTSGTLDISFNTGNATAGTSMTATGTYRFIGENTGNGIVYLRSNSFVGSVDNVKMYVAEGDRSLNNKGLAVVGTVTKTAVATGAELVSYGPFTAANYLEQSYNSDFNWQGSNFSVYGWFKLATNNSQQTLMMLMEPTGQVDYMLIEQQNNGDMRFQVDRQDGASVGYASQLEIGTWYHYCGVDDLANRRAYLYINGKEQLWSDASHTASTNFDNTTAKLTIGRKPSASYNDASSTPFGGQMALWKISNERLTEEQIMKIYNDEKKLFQPNAKCTLYGSSDEIKAMGYDDSTDTLHVGTSSGRSDFIGLNRINNTTTAITHTVSASNGFIAEQ